ncbi:MAG: hypothetical protein HC771_12365 [Synechococcales cyanobacterium CRU_2_2]|nr:hypothetical protein [Synechococcales cyanobacterium CRU_2_2]
MMNVFAASGIVMWPLLLFSLLAIALIIERLIFWLRISHSQTPMLRHVLCSYRIEGLRLGMATQAPGSDDGAEVE